MNIYYKKHRDYYLAYHKEWYRRHKAEGMCVTCGREKAAEGRVRCTKRLAAAMESYRRNKK